MTFIVVNDAIFFRKCGLFSSPLRRDDTLKKLIVVRFKYNTKFIIKLILELYLLTGKFLKIVGMTIDL